MRKAVTGLAIAVAAAIGASGATAFADRGDHGNRGSKTFTLVEHPISDVTIDNGTPGDSVGDLLPFANPVFDATDSRQVGTDQGYCIRTNVGVAFECTWTTFLKGGQIVVQGPFPDSGEPSTLAITGGTGIYARAHGTMTLRPNAADPGKFDFVFHVKR